MIYKYHQTVRGELGYEDTESGDGHTLHKNGNVMSIEDIDEISKEEFLTEKNEGTKELIKQV